MTKASKRPGQLTAQLAKKLPLVQASAAGIVKLRGGHDVAQHYARVVAGEALGAGTSPATAISMGVQAGLKLNASVTSALKLLLDNNRRKANE